MGLSQYATLVYSSLSHVYLYLSYVKDMVVRVTLMLNSHLAVDLLVALAGKGSLVGLLLYYSMKDLLPTEL